MEENQDSAASNFDKEPSKINRLLLGTTILLLAIVVSGVSYYLGTEEASEKQEDLISLASNAPEVKSLTDQSPVNTDSPFPSATPAPASPVATPSIVPSPSPSSAISDNFRLVFPSLRPFVIFKVDEVSLALTKKESSGFFSYKYTYEGKLKTNAAGEVKYRWEITGEESTEESIVFSSAETKTVTTSFESKPFSHGTVILRVTSPNDISSNSLLF